ncbi:hypothetical protein LOTGIDRAFT_132243, partial [Lottia gigantea]
EEELVNLRKLYAESKEANESFEKDRDQLKTLLETERSERKQEVSDLEEARELLISQKLEQQNKMVALQTLLDEKKGEQDKIKEEAEKLQEKLKHENESLKKHSENSEKKMKEREKQYEEDNVRTEMQLSVLNENLTTIRGDLTVTQQQLDDANKLNDELKGEKLELDAKLANNNDERRLLVERCLASETECERLREKVTELRRKLDDTEAALQELGRENQTLQITSTKVTNRKWTDDTEATDCSACRKAFSVTNRRHHCRNCGHIFCNDCSSKTVPLAASKKPVRVCDACFTEVSNKR